MTFNIYFCYLSERNSSLVLHLYLMIIWWVPYRLYALIIYLFQPSFTLSLLGLETFIRFSEYMRTRSGFVIRLPLCFLMFSAVYSVLSTINLFPFIFASFFSVLANFSWWMRVLQVFMYNENSGNFQLWTNC